MKPLVALLFASLVSAGAMAADAPAAPKVDVAKGAESYAAICVACHGADGNSAVPLQASLAQQHPEYLHKQLMEFKSGARQDPIMQGFAAALSEEDSRNISWWLASQKAKPGVATQPELVVMGERIYRGGIPDRHIPACAGCHSPNGAGIPSQYPRLSGQHAEYTVKQMVAFRDGTRANNAVMQGVAARMNDREIKAVSDYIAGLR
ncbi:c-type cytochrome [Ottowia sp.]|uniref:c-type cytochrome n=1 Tax=Ottowia sp. TaxID=1898956 RepID=UPI002BDB6108|nr:c-type cytochrome [Ottowia sp.]HRN74559.1 c-type cytochrome [Ottowia sp.]HRQ01985.1 c-type cytochrome [Ottowia sp.]